MKVRQLDELTGGQRQSLVFMLDAAGFAQLTCDLLRDGHTLEVTLIAVEQDQAVGLIEGRTDHRWYLQDEQPGHVSPFGRIATIVVAASHPRQGVGRRLVAEFAEVAERNGCTWLELQEHWTDDGGRRAAFFASLGLQRVAHQPQVRVWGAPLAQLKPE